MRSSLLLITYRRIKEGMPAYVLECVHKLIPLGFLLIILDLVGLFVLYPIVKLLLDPTYVFTNNWLSSIYTGLKFENEQQFVLGLVLAALGYFLVKSWAYFRVVRKQSDLAYSMVSNLIIDQYKRYIHAPIAFRSSGSIGDLLRSIIEIPHNFTSGILLPYVIFVNEMALALIITVAIFIYSPLLCLTLGLTIIPTFYLYTRLQRRRLSKVSAEREKRNTQMFNQGKMGLEGFIEILVSGNDGYFIENFKKSVQSFSHAMSKLYAYNAFSPRVMEFLLVASIFVVLYGATLLGYDLAVVATFLATFALAAYRLIPSVNKIILCYNNIKSAEFVYPHFSSESLALEVGTGEIGEVDSIKLEEVSYTYPEDKNSVLENVSLSIRRGEFIGLRGESGSGKTTLLRLLLKLLKPTSGEIQVNDSSLLDIGLSDWYGQVNYVPQQVTIFPGSIQSNIALGTRAEEIDHQRLAWAIEGSMLGAFISKLPDGLDTLMGDQALNISGGQRQRIGIARALYQSGKVLILDEITSSLDEATESSIADCIYNLTQNGYTVLMVSHNRNALKYCNRIYTLERGRLSEPLTHDML